MQDNGVVEYDRERQEQVKQAERVKNAGLKRGEERMAAVVVRVPKREGTLFQGFHPEQAWRDKKLAEIPLDQQILAGKDVKKKQSGKKDEQESHSRDFCGFSHTLLLPERTEAKYMVSQIR